jgi:uncharacterized repeat protein (TIGR01451 family)
MGLGVDPATGLLYISTGESGAHIKVFDLSFAETDSHLPNCRGNPTGLCIPGRDISYNPLGFSKDDGLGEGACVNAGGRITYTICYENGNQYDVTGAEINDTLPADVTFVSATGGGVYNAGTHSVHWTIGDIAAGAPQPCVELVVQVVSDMEAGAEISNAATIDSNETPQTTQTEITPVCLLDCNNNGMNDGSDIAAGTSNDCNDNGVPDECDHEHARGMRLLHQERHHAPGHQDRLLPLLHPSWYAEGLPLSGRLSPARTMGDAAGAQRTDVVRRPRNRGSLPATRSRHQVHCGIRSAVS